MDITDETRLVVKEIFEERECLEQYKDVLELAETPDERLERLKMLLRHLREMNETCARILGVKK